MLSLQVEKYEDPLTEYLVGNFSPELKLRKKFCKEMVKSTCCFASLLLRLIRLFHTLQRARLRVAKRRTRLRLRHQWAGKRKAKPLR